MATGAHAAAGLAHDLKLREASRLLKLAESNVRIAAALLAGAESEHRAAAKASPSASPASPGGGVSRSAKRRAKKKAASAMDLDPFVDEASGNAETVPAVQAAISDGQRGASYTGSTDRTLGAKSSRERSPRLGATVPLGIPSQQKVLLVPLVIRRTSRTAAWC